MRDLLSWNIYFGRIAGVHVRVHAFFVLLVAAAIAMRHEVPFWYGSAAVGLLFFSVVWHELAHCFAALKSGGSAEHVLLWPLGGLIPIGTSALDPLQEWPTAVAGVLANLCVCAFAAPIFLVSGQYDLLHLNPLSLPPYGETLDWHTALALLFWINWVLVLVNLLPAQPLDGGRMLRAALWPRTGYRTSVLQVARCGRVIAVLLVALGLAVTREHPAAILPLTLLAMVLFFSARQEVDKLLDPDAEDVVLGYDFSQGYTSLERSVAAPRKPAFGALRRWFERRRNERLRRVREVEQSEDRRVDEVLARLHESGFAGLSNDDRALLARVSSRYRNRHRT